MHKDTNESIRLDTAHGYRLDGDDVELSAQLLLGEGTSLANWKVQLWAHDVLANGAPGGIKIAETSLEAAHVTKGVARLQTRLNAMLPPTGRYYNMALVLAPDGGDGTADVANYAERQWISGPFLQGAVGYSIGAGQVTVHVEQVCNPRDASNLSGTLALELWAVSESYFGGAVRGHQLAGLVLGTLAGQSSCSHVATTVNFDPPPSGQWQLVLMLREWTATGYVTRDYRTFDTLYHARDAAEFATDTRALESAPATPSTPALTAASPVAPTAVKSPLDKRVSVQTASVEELTRATGLSKKVAQEIVRTRPFKSLDELTKVKGIGAKSLRALRGFLKV